MGVNSTNDNIVALPNNIFHIQYETRKESSCWLREVTKIVHNPQLYQDFENRNCDYCHFAEVFKAAYTRLSALDQDLRNRFGEVLRKGTRFIWYYPTSASGTNADIFDRLNAGKIGLNNAELIKALFLQQSNWESEDVAKNKTLALEWNAIENALQEKEFWAFIYSSHHPFAYDSHIEYLFDLLQGKKASDKENIWYTFNKYLKSYREMLHQPELGISRRINWVQQCWMEVKELYDTLMEWYADRKIYHRVGFILQHVSNESVLTLKNTLKEQKRSVRLQKLDEIIQTEISHIQSSQLFYGRPQLSEVLFLYNVLLEDRRSSDIARFSFADYKGIRKKKGWDLEHVASHIDYTPDEGRAEDLCKDIIELFTGDYPTRIAQEYNISPHSLELLDVKELEICKNALRLLNMSKNERIQNENASEDLNQLEQFYDLISDYFDIKGDGFDKIYIGNTEKDEKDFIWNFVLLNAGTNRSYGNNIYPVKRRRILQDDFDVYTPVGTRNVFEKAYSRKITQMFFWSRTDAKAYWEDICNTLKPYTSLKLPF